MKLGNLSTSWPRQKISDVSPRKKRDKSLLKNLRDAERDVIYEEYRHRIDELISGTVKRFFRGANIVVDLGKVEAIMPMKNYPKTEKFRVGEKVLALLLGCE